MKEYSYFPFERNRYFYGKLLSVEDFQREQLYINNKRRMLNKILYGDGVLCGLHVVEVDEENISVEAGAALDCFGREIVVDCPVVKRLSVLDGFQEHCVENENGGDIYLCIEYSEEETEPVHCIGAAYNDEGKPLEYNKYKEGFHLFLTSDEPESNSGFLSEAYEEVHTIYDRNGIRIVQAMQKYINSNQESVIRVIVEKNGNKDDIFFKYNLELAGVSCDGQSNMTVVFRETDHKKADFYELDYIVRSGIGEIEGKVSIISDSFVLEIGEYRQTLQINAQFSFAVISCSIAQAIWNRFYRTSSEDILSLTCNMPLYLAKISLIRAEDTYIIERVDNLPYCQYIWNNRLLGSMSQMKMKTVNDNINDGHDITVLSEQRVERNTDIGKYNFGVAEIPLGIGSTAGKCFFSDEIVHGLGIGSVVVSVGAVNFAAEGKEIVYGQRDIFQEKKGQVNVETAVKVFVDKGSFCVGIRCLSEVSVDKITVHWLAVRSQEEIYTYNNAVMNIRPSLPRIHVRDTLKFEAVVGDKMQIHVNWSVKEKFGGSIDDNGLYTAPNRAGIYEIQAVGAEDKNMRASVYVIVAEAEQW